MGRDVHDSSPAARRVFEEAEEAIGISLRELCFEGPEQSLTDTVNAQPAILTVSVACLAALRERYELGRPSGTGFVAGHSLGEYSALVAAGALEFRDAVALVRERGRLMKEAGSKFPGGMAAILG
ncbi:MAG: ACP S-malonyltransferase, partial [Chloroflexi bacterium]|nr:ACP S-malonyltransferase [Chloroflexota bacterium]